MGGAWTSDELSAVNRKGVGGGGEGGVGGGGGNLSGGTYVGPSPSSAVPSANDLELEQFQKARSGGPAAAQKLFDSLTKTQNGGDGSGGGRRHLGSSSSSSSMIDSFSLPNYPAGVTSFDVPNIYFGDIPVKGRAGNTQPSCQQFVECRYAVDAEHFVLQVPSLAAKMEAERRRHKKRKSSCSLSSSMLLSSSSSSISPSSLSSKRHQKGVADDNDNKSQKESLKSQSGSRGSAGEDEMKNVGDLSRDAIKAGWRMKLSARHEGKPYYYRLK